jgi:hypothetical protein
MDVSSSQLPRKIMPRASPYPAQNSIPVVESEKRLRVLSLKFMTDILAVFGLESLVAKMSKII